MAFNFPQNPSPNQTYSYSGKTFRWNGVAWLELTGPTSIIQNAIVSAATPANPTAGLLWFKTTDQTLYIWVPALGGGSWVPASECPDCPDYQPVIVSASSPTNPSEGSLWFKTTDQTLYIWITDLSGGSWVPVSEPPDPSEYPPVTISASPPVNPTAGLLWFKTTNQTLYVWVPDLSGGSWVAATGSANCPEYHPVTISSSPPANPSEGDLWYNPNQIGLSVWYLDIDGGQWVSTVPVSIDEGGGTPLANEVPLPLGTASPGIGLGASRYDHVHPLPTAVQVGADPTGTATNTLAAHVASVDPHPQYLTPTELASELTNKADLVDGVIPTSQIPDTAVVYSQPTPALTWTINHNLGYRPVVEILDSGSQEIEGDVSHPSVNQTVVYLNPATAGIARLT